jgi:hypothetical protein
MSSSSCFFKGISILIFFGLGISLAHPGELVVSGVYQGNNIFVQNPYNPKSGVFCTTQVFVNDRLLLENPKASAFQVDLTYLKINELVVIRILFHEGCSPKVVNPHVLQGAKGFQFLYTQADENAITWMSQGERPGGMFVLERQLTDFEWEVLSETPGKGAGNAHLYSLRATHIDGENRYRLHYEAPEQEDNFSVEFAFTLTEYPITFSPSMVTNKITLSQEADYKITDFNGQVVMEGRAREIFVNALRPGQYYLVVQNRPQKFIKK